MTETDNGGGREQRALCLSIDSPQLLSVLGDEEEEERRGGDRDGREQGRSNEKKNREEVRGKEKKG